MNTQDNELKQVLVDTHCWVTDKCGEDAVLALTQLIDTKVREELEALPIAGIINASGLRQDVVLAGELSMRIAQLSNPEEK